MRIRKLFTDEQIEQNPEIKKAIEYGKKKGYNVNEWIEMEEEDYAVLYEGK